MQKKLFLNMVMAVLLAGLFFTVSCAQKAVVPSSETTNGTAIQSTQNKGPSAEELAKQKAAREARIKEQELKEAAARKKAAARGRFVSQDIHFAFDSSQLTPMSQVLLKEKAQWLENNPSVHVRIEGNCDERGTTEYNMALGERRALSVKNFLVDLGISGSRLTTISYGEEKPIDPRHNEEAWAKNRRVHFTILP